MKRRGCDAKWSTIGFISRREKLIISLIIARFMIAPYKMFRVKSGKNNFVMNLILIAATVCLNMLSADALSDYCQTETFNASCDFQTGHQVVIMDEARYGLMRHGRCIKRDYGYIGCTTDVLRVADRKCSGRPRCQVRLPDEDFEEKNECPEDFKSYLEAGYRCVTISASSGKSPCTPTRQPKITATSKLVSGFLSSFYASETGCGSALSPWILEALPGQKINLTLWDFSWGQRKSCFKYAVLSDQGKRSDVMVCNNQNRVSTVHQSTGNTLEVELTTETADDKSSFLVEFMFVGCPIPVSPPGGWIKQNGDAYTSGCNNNEATWSLVCEGTTWSQPLVDCINSLAIGKFENSSVGSNFFGSLLLSGLQSELAIVVVLLTAIAITVCILIVGISCITCRRSSTGLPSSECYVTNNELRRGQQLASDATRLASIHRYPPLLLQPQQQQLVRVFDDKSVSSSMDGYFSETVPNAECGRNTNWRGRTVDSNDYAVISETSCLGSSDGLTDLSGYTQDNPVDMTDKRDASMIHMRNKVM